jgi:hypothetical protein
MIRAALGEPRFAAAMQAARHTPLEEVVHVTMVRPGVSPNGAATAIR